MTMSPYEFVRYAWLAWLLSWMVAARWSSRAERRPSPHAESTYRVVTLVGAILLFDLHPRWPWTIAAIWNLPAAIAWTMVVLTLCGFAFAWWARLTLGALWSSGVTRKADHEIVRAGPYGVVRHPIYSGLLLSVVATALLRGTVAACAGAACFVIGWVVKARLEERFLRRELGEDRYDAYARRVPMLVPFMR